MSAPHRHTWEHVIVTGVLQTRGPLRIGSGFDEPAGPGAADRDGVSGLVTAVCRDGAGAPYLPASTLRGFLRRRGPSDPAGAERLFGSARRARQPGLPLDQESLGRAGALRVYDARCDTAEPLVLDTETRIAIDPITRSARDRHLFTQQLVPKGTAFRCRFELERIDTAELDAFLAALGAFDGGAANGLGAGRARLHGRLCWTPEGLRVRTLSRADHLHWLCTDQENYQEQVLPMPGPDQDATPVSGPVGAALRLSLRIYPRSPLLVSNPPRKTGERPAVRSFRVVGGAVQVPAASLKGLLRAQARRILMTMLADRHPRAPERQRRQVAEGLTGEVFGSTRAMAGLFVDEARGAFDQDRDCHPQTFNAIDRFTGGVADQRLYQVLAVRPRRLDWQVLVQPRLLAQPWALGLLCHLLRDALEGDLALGWGRARGFGVLRVILAEADPNRGDQTALDQPAPPWATVLPVIEQTLSAAPRSGAQDWVDALEQRIDGDMAAADTPQEPADER
ncbi:RAMP superfamily CRISPR-associated protein [uncultured Thiodictyon sp.]|jgi:CRISPR/Cas system CSM-associated protein Csm3 (group 7 of RAMP superfamily)|uniref:RAMP superfamily CRISPR-associated protein n=1 Tax=uncultured Thiodictyon sp. TaxID=1846217 RepID=UPI0025DB78CD|nr:RAMP superfamily CRISPR-associated protein [uncultured Thiodictyon sp.]